MRAYADNVFVVFEPEEKVTAGGLHIPQQHQEKTRWAKVVAVGPGHHSPITGKLIPTTLEVGQYVLVDRLAGQPYDWDLSVPRHNKKGCEWEDDGLGFRAIREDEAMAVMDEADYLAMRGPA